MMAGCSKSPRIFSACLLVENSTKIRRGMIWLRRTVLVLSAIWLLVVLVYVKSVAVGWSWIVFLFVLFAIAPVSIVNGVLYLASNKSLIGKKEG